MAPVSNPDKDMDGGDCGESFYIAQWLLAYRILMQFIQTGSLFDACTDSADTILNIMNSIAKICVYANTRMCDMLLLRFWCFSLWMLIEHEVLAMTLTECFTL